MEKKLTIIIGAGASHDVVAGPESVLDPNFRPPLVSDIFSNEFREILAKYPKANILSSTILMRLEQRENLESILRDLSQARDEHIVRQFQQVAFYLQELFYLQYLLLLLMLFHLALNISLFHNLDLGKNMFLKLLHNLFVFYQL